MITASAMKFVNGTILTGHRHHNIIADAKEAGYTRQDVAQAEQGFVDQTRKFYDRKEAGKHAEECGQVVVGHATIQHVYNPRLGLFSEDLW